MLAYLPKTIPHIGMPESYLHPAKCIRKTIKDSQIKLKSRYVQKWHQEASSIKLDKSTSEDSYKLRTYKTFKNNFKSEKYLLLSNFEHRKILSPFRISSHRLEIEQGHYTAPKTLLSSCICKQCNLNLVKREPHFLSNVQNTMEHLYSKINNKSFNQLSDSNKCNWLVLMEDMRIIR